MAHALSLGAPILSGKTSGGVGGHSRTPAQAAAPTLGLSHRYTVGAVAWRHRIDGELQAALAAHARSGADFESWVGDGWHDLVVACHRAVVAEFPQYELLAVKEKYGALDFQAFPHRWQPPARDGTFTAWTREEATRLDSIVQSFEEKSVVTCERCGQPGKLRGERKRWLTLCDSCDAEIED